MRIESGPGGSRIEVEVPAVAVGLIGTIDPEFVESFLNVEVVRD